VFLGIDATNLRRGGGRTHLIEFLGAANPQAQGINRVLVWASRDTLDQIEDRDWLIKRNPAALNAGLLSRSLWQRFSLSQSARSEQCDILFVPGGSYAGDFHPIVTMSRNMLPFEWQELRRYGWTLTTLKLLLLRWTQTRSFRRADGVVFLTEYARAVVQRVTGNLEGSVSVIPHGLNTRFLQRPRKASPIANYSDARPFRILYVSIINQYKHQWRVVEAIGRLRRRTGWPLVLELVGPSYPPALRQLYKAIEDWDTEQAWVKYHGAIPYDQLHDIYQQADLGLFASSCENMPNILLETMAAGLPVACSDRGPMPEILGDAGVYFDPLDPASIGQALDRLIRSPRLRADSARACHARAAGFRWDKCAEQTFGFLADVAAAYSKQADRRCV
jgi:glycosyltransferase involved in cell wall biosynthesis